MKFFGKMMTTFTALALMVSLGFATPALGALSVARADGYQSNLGASIQITNYKPAYDYNDAAIGDQAISGGTTVRGIVLPQAAVTGLDKTTGAATPVLGVKVVDSVGRDFTSKVHTTDTAGKWVFAPDSFIGSYIVTYIATADGMTTATKEIEISFTGTNPVISFDNNVAQIIPKKVNPGAKIVFPYPTVKLGDEDVPEATVKSNTTITLKDSNHQGVNLTEENGFMTFTVPANAEGTYTVTYKYSTLTSYTVSKTFSFNVVSTATFNPDEDIELEISNLSSSMDSLNLELGVEATLPTPVVVNNKANKEEVDVYTEITITCVNPTQDVAEGTALSWKVDDFKFTPTIQGDYRITYKVTDFYGKTVTVNYPIKTNVTKTSSTLKIKAVGEYSNAYNENDQTYNDEILNNLKDTFEDLTDLSYTIPGYVQVGQSVELPAIFGIGFGDYKDLKFTRTVYYKGTPTIIQEEAYEKSIYTFDKVGTYSINYQVAYSSNSSLRRYLSFNVEVIESYEDVTAPEVKIANLPGTTEKGKTILVNAPTATDTRPDNKDVANERLLTQVFYYFDNNNASPTEVTKNKDGKYEVKVPAGITATTLTIYAMATDAAGNKGYSENKVIKILDFSKDITAPTLDGDFAFPADWGSGVFEQGTEITIPTASFTDGSNNLVVKAYIEYDGNIIAQYSTAGDQRASLTGKTFILSKAGEYIITYCAIDPNNNSNTFSIRLTSTSTAVPSIVINGLAANVEYGETINLASKAVVTLENQIVDYDVQMIFDDTTVDEAYLENLASSTLLIQVLGNAALPARDGESIIAQKGTITVNYWAKSANGLYDKTGPRQIVMTAADSTAPTFNVAEGGPNATHPFNDNAADENVTADNTIKIPWFVNANDNVTKDNITFAGSGVNTASYKIVVQYTDSDEPLATFEANDSTLDYDNLSVVATKNGTLKVTYSVSDREGNIASEDFHIAVGDVTPPQISLGDLNLTTAKKVGDKLVIDLTKIQVTESGMDYKDVKISVTCDGEAVTFERPSDAKEITINLDKAGTYYINFDCTDPAGNVATTVTKTFSVSTDTAAPVNSTTVWGTVLIIIALIVLGVVIYFFVRPSKSGTQTVTTKKNDKEKKDDDKIIK